MWIKKSTQQVFFLGLDFFVKFASLVCNHAVLFVCVQCNCAIVMYVVFVLLIITSSQLGLLVAQTLAYGYAFKLDKGKVNGIGSRSG